MSYKLEWRASPNFTPGSQTKAVYGRPRSIEAGAGHWWNTPEAGARHDGIVSIFLNPARQAAAHAVVSAGRVTEMVRAGDTAWCTNNANPFTYAIELDPRVMYRWQSASAANKALANQIFETVAEYIADKRYHNLPWYPHKKWWSTQCNPINWNEIMTRAKQIRAAKDAPPAPAYKFVAMSNPRKLIAKVDLKPLDLKNNVRVGDTIKAGTEIEFASETDYKGAKWLRSKYSTTQNLPYAIELANLKEVPPPQPEWVKNLVDIADVKLMVLNGPAVIYDLNSGKPTGAPIPQGTWVDVAKQTTVGGKVYLISKYSSDNAMANGILKSALGVPAPTPEPPKPEPEWLKNWQDIADVEMYTRMDNVQVVNMLDGKTVSTIAKKGTAVKIASATEWMGQKYLITEYSTGKKLPHGIRLLDLDANPVPPTTTPIPPDPAKPIDDVIRENNSLLKQILALLQQVWDKITGK